MPGLKCHDCNGAIKTNQQYMPYKVGTDNFCKCAQCYGKDSKLRYYQSTEVYSRVVGYIRPVKQWNKGKRAEYGDRCNYKCA